MSTENPEQSEHFGNLSDEEEAAEPASTEDGPAADGEYDPQQGSPDSGPHAPDYEEPLNP